MLSLATITAAREAEERRQAEEAQREADARRADYLERCARWSPLMEDGPDDIGRRDMEQEESENAPAYIVHDTTAGPFAFEDYATGSILAAVAYIHRNISVDNPHRAGFPVIL